MVQPGNFSEKSLLDFIKLIPRLRPLPSNSDVWESERQPLPVSSDDYKLPLQVNLPPLDHAHTVSIANKSDSLECCRHNLRVINESEYGKQDSNSIINNLWNDSLRTSGTLLGDGTVVNSNIPQCNTTKNTSSQTDTQHAISTGTQMDVFSRDKDSQTMGIQPELVQGTSIIVDELLFFVQNKLSVNPQPLDMLVQTCANFYDADEIFTSKKALFENIRQDRFRLIKRIGKDKKQDDLMDICKLFLSTEIEQMPMFVAKELSNVPCTTDTYDVTKVHKELEQIKKSICSLTDNQTALTNLVNSKRERHNRTQYNTDSQTQTQSTDPLEICPQQHHVQLSQNVTSRKHRAHISIRHHSGSNDASSTASSAHGIRNSVTREPSVSRLNISLSSSPVRTTDQRHDDNKATADSTSLSTGSEPLRQGSLFASCSTPVTDEDHHTKDTSISASSDYNFNFSSASFRTVDEASITGLSTATSRRSARMSRAPDRSYRSSQSHIKSSTPRTSTYTDNNQRRHNSVMYGKGKSVGLRAVGHKPKSNISNGNTNITGTFVSRLDARTTAAELALFIRHEFGLSVRSEKLTNKTGLCSSFYIPGIVT